jgi:hypothetical protein
MTRSVSFVILASMKSVGVGVTQSVVVERQIAVMPESTAALAAEKASFKLTLVVAIPRLPRRPRLHLRRHRLRPAHHPLLTSSSRRDPPGTNAFRLTPARTNRTGMSSY